MHMATIFGRWPRRWPNSITAAWCSVQFVQPYMLVYPGNCLVGLVILIRPHSSLFSQPKLYNLRIQRLRPLFVLDFLALRGRLESPLRAYAQHTRRGKGTLYRGADSVLPGAAVLPGPGRPLHVRPMQLPVRRARPDHQPPPSPAAAGRRDPVSPAGRSSENTQDPIG